jgi:hypothetical protein
MFVHALLGSPDPVLRTVFETLRDRTAFVLRLGMWR